MYKKLYMHHDTMQYFSKNQPAHTAPRPYSLTIRKDM